MAYTFKSPETDQEWQNYFLLRWQVLREPWQQALGSERDEREDTAYHVMAVDNSQSIVGTGRLHRLANSRVQIRYMAVNPVHQGRGVGSHILMLLEEQARNWDCRDIVLNARTTHLGFYEKHKYQVIAETPRLFGIIAHKQMYKQLIQYK